MVYQAFLSYSHKADGKLSPMVQSGLHRLAKRWYQLRAMRVFRDKTSLSANPALWAAIEKALGTSEYFLLLASPQSAQSHWVQREVDWWIANRPAEKLLILLTDGELEWAAQAGDFDWSRTTALPQILNGRFGEEPLYIDLRWAKTADSLSLRHSQFRGAILDIAATVRGIPKDELDGEDVRRHRKTRRLATAAIAGLLAFAVTAGWMAYVANAQRRRADLEAEQATLQRNEATLQRNEATLQRNEARLQRDLAIQRELEAKEQRRIAEERRREAERQTRIARSRELSVSAMAQLDNDPELGLLLAIEAGTVMATPQAEETLRQALLDSHLRRTLKGSEERMSNAAFSPDGRRVATASWDGAARVWNLADGKLVFEVDAGVSIVNSAKFSPDGRFLVTDNSLAKVRVWEAATGRRVLEVGNAGDPSVSADSKLLLTVSLDTASVWDLESGRLRSELKGHSGFVNNAAFSPDSGRVVTASKDGIACLWEAATGKLERKLEGHDEEVRSARFSSQGSLVVTTSGKAARIWATESGELVRELTGNQIVTHAEFGPDRDDLLMIVESYHTRLWNLFLDTPVLELPGVFTFSPDGEFLARAEGVWEAGSGRRVSVFYGPPHVGANSVAFSPDGRLLVTTYDDGTARVWAAGTNASITELSMAPRPDSLGTLAITSIAFSRDGARIGAATGHGQSAVWDTSSGRLLWQAAANDDALTGIAFSPDGRRAVTTGKDDLARVWDAESGRLVADLRGHTSWVTGAAYSPDGKWVLTRSYDRTARLWATGKSEPRFVLGGHRAGVYCAEFDPTGRIVATCDEGKARLWSTDSGRVIRELPGSTGAVTGATFSPTGRYVVTLSSGPTGDAKARIWEVASGRLALTVSEVSQVVFGPEDRRLVTVGEESVRIRDWQAGLTLAEIPRRGTVLWSPDGRFLLTADREEVQLWYAATGEKVTGMSFRGLPLLADSVAFSPDGQRLAVGGLDGVRLYACEVCVPFDQLLALARRRVTRKLTSGERRIYLHEAALPGAPAR